jgi:hypothetical protein
MRAAFNVTIEIRVPPDAGSAWFFRKGITVRWVASSLEEFRRVTSRVATFVIVITVLLSPTVVLLPRLQVVRDSLVSTYLLLALILKVIMRRSDVNSLSAVRMIEAVCLVALLLAGFWVVYFAWMNGVEGLIGSVIDGAILAAATLVVQKNISNAKMMASQSS